mmetsp:Transcript_18871/g.52707  ORF Transcript_18871/g.52707 Transcript_18871/m.52707 type:complete len:86 (-) Transcript_18871:55-312(-)
MGRRRKTTPSLEVHQQMISTTPIYNSLRILATGNKKFTLFCSTFYPCQRYIPEYKFALSSFKLSREGEDLYSVLRYIVVFVPRKA